MKFLCNWNPLLSFIYLFSFLCFINHVLCQSSNNSEWLESLATNFEVMLLRDVRRSTAADELREIYLNLSPKITSLETRDLFKEAVTKIGKVFKTAENVIETLAENADALNEENAQKKKDLVLTGKQVTFYQESENQTQYDFKQIPLPPNTGTGHDLIEKENITLRYYNSKCRCNDSHQLFQIEGEKYLDCFKPPDEFKASESFSNHEISLSSSAVHIPVDVYNEGPDVLRDVAWTHDMESSFKKVMCSASLNGGKTKWLYMATMHGVLRYFPARRWNVPCGDIDFFDSRSTPWFVQSMSSPKDVIIMVDTSGSMVGLTLNLIYLSVNHILSSLSHNDFFNIVLFSVNATYANPNCPGLLQATPRNKELAFSWMQGIEPVNKSSFRNGFEFAFEVLNLKNSNISVKSMRASCNPLILLLTDGGAEYQDEVFKKWNLDKYTRVFTYSVGKHFSSTDSLKDMACDNRGVFMPIPSDSATHIQTMDYLFKLSKALAYSRVKINKWTLPYEDHLGLGTVMSVSRPILTNYQPKTGNTHSHVLGTAGVIGTDILYSDIKNILDAGQWGTFTYFFGLENNGHLFYHPELKKGRLNSPVTIDISDIEHMDINQIRKSMIDRLTASDVPLQRTILSKDGRHLTNSPYNYSYAPIPKCIFSVALAASANHMDRIDASRTIASSTEWTLDSILHEDDSLYSAAFGLLCNGDKPKQLHQCDPNSPEYVPSNTSSTPSYLLRDVIEDAAPCSSIGSDSAQRDELFMHGEVTGRLAKYWSGISHSSMVEAVFVASESKPSVLRVKHIGDGDNREQIESALNNPPSKDYFLRPLLHSSTTVFTLLQFNPVDPGTTTFSDVTEVTDVYTTSDGRTMTVGEQSTATPSFLSKVKYFVASEALGINLDEKNLIPAVTGAVLDYDSVKEQFWDLKSTQCSDPRACMNSFDCRDTDRLCAVLDDGAMLLMSNQDEHQDKIGRFFGEIDGELMRRMQMPYHLYKSKELLSHQTVCENCDKKASSGMGNFRLPTVSSVLNAGWWIMSSLSLILQNLLFGLVALMRGVFSEDANCTLNVPYEDSEYISPNTNSAKRHCILRTKVFSFDFASTVLDGKDRCNRSFMAHRIPNTNLLFLVSDLDNNSCSVPFPSTDTPEYVMNNESCPTQRYRRHPFDKCYDADSLPLGMDPECGSAAARLTNLALMLSTSFLLFWMNF